ncbi:hypothetical protein ACIGEZ_14700 [Streptomyces sp. NPDC085481]|uniref:hypothetical protein n=1 Tax=Streptomyces sp. NPDC085481 TaxID=3365727 RepID=UPI0037CFAC4E
MERAWGKRSVAVGGDAHIVVTGDHNRIELPAPDVRSAYREQVRRLAPAELVDRDTELAELAAFCQGEAGYRWWRAEAWAGKTALMATFALTPPPGVRVVPFFVTARWAAQNDAVAFVDVVVEQLAELAGEPLPALLTAATREAHLLRLYGAAGRACAERGERLVLLVDGLDEDRGVTTGPDAHSIASLLPPDATAIVSGRLHPPLPPDVPDGHPLRDPATVRILAPSPAAGAIRLEAERELKHLLEAGGPPYELLALLSAAGGGLTADDLAELTGEVPYRVRDILRTSTGRTFARGGDAYLLAHEELAAQAREMLGARATARFRDRLHGWAGEWRERGWPEGTPEYLLRGYGAMLRAAGDVDRLVGCALDPVRHDRLLAATGGDAFALGEVTAAETAVQARGDRADLVPTMLRLGIRRDGLELSGRLVPPAVAAGWAAVGEVDRALALARGAGGERAVVALCAVAGRLLERGERATAEEVAAEAEARSSQERNGLARDTTAEETARLLIALGAYDRAERQIRRIAGDRGRDRPLYALIRAHGAAGRFGSALALASGESNVRVRANARSETVRALVRAGRIEEAERAAREPDSHHAVRAVVLLRAAPELRAAGHEGPGAAALAEGLEELRLTRPGEAAMGLRRKLIQALVAAGEFARAQGLSHDRFGAGDQVVYAAALARAGEWDLAWSVVDGLDDDDADEAMEAFAQGMADAGDLDAAEELGRELSGYLHYFWEGVAEARLERDEPDAVESLLDRLTHSGRGFGVIGELVRRRVAAGRIEQARAVLARMSGPEHELRLSAFMIGPAAGALHDAGHTAEARELLVSAEERSRRPPRHETLRRLTRIAPALASAGRRPQALALLDAVDPHEDRFEPDAVPALIAVGQLELAEEQARQAEEFARLSLFADVIAALVAEGSYEHAEDLVQERGDYREDVAAAARAYLDAGATDRAAGYAERLSSDFDIAEVYAEVALAVEGEGRRGQADEWLDTAVDAAWPRVATSAVMLPSGVRAQLALGRRDEAAALLRKATRAWSGRYGHLQPEHLLRSWVLFGAYDHAVDLLRSLPPDAVGKGLPLLAADLARAGQYARAEALLAEAHHLGPKCAAAYTVLATEHPDPAEARRFTALALHLGPWYDALPAVSAMAPETVDLVAAEGARLRRALEV